MAGNPSGLWRWPLWSWRHLTITLAAAALILLGVGRVTATGHDDVPRSTAASHPEPALALSTPTGRDMPSATAPSPDAPVLAEPEGVALAFVRVWAQPDAPDAEWRAACGSFATEAFARSLNTSSSTAVPASRVAGSVATQARSDGRALVRVPTDGGAVLVGLVQADGRWRVDSLAPEQGPVAAPPAG